jgi:LDH2 family malate/lactate/ureidoglycolate dehydrogenase
MRNTIERARTTGVAVAAVGVSNHCGAMYYYTQMAIEDDMIGIAATNALPTMAPWGGSERILGMNPIAVAIPDGEEMSFILDTANQGLKKILID